MPAIFCSANVNHSELCNISPFPGTHAAAASICRRRAEARRSTKQNAEVTMGFLDIFSSTKKPAAGVPVLSAEQLKQKLLATNRPTAPYRIVDGAAAGVDVVDEWQVV